MATIRVFAHHPASNVPVAFGSLPPGGGPTPPDKTYWAELKDLNTVTAQGYGPPPSIGPITDSTNSRVVANLAKPADDGYGGPATNFGVQRVGLSIWADQYPFWLEFTLVSPTSQVAVVPSTPPTPIPPNGWVIWVPWSLALAAGVWKIEVRMRQGAAGPLPNEFFWNDQFPNPQMTEPYAARNAGDGLIALIFDDTRPTTTTTTSTTTTPVPTSTTAMPSTTTTTTGTTGTSKPTTSTTRTTQTTTTSSNGPGCLCVLLLVVGLGLVAASAIAFMAWGCSGFVNAALLTAGIVLGVIGLIVLGIWVFLCRPCAEEVLLAKIFIGLAAILVVLAIVFAVVGQFGCSAGAVVSAALFLAVAATLRAVGRKVGCP